MNARPASAGDRDGKADFSAIYADGFNSLLDGIAAERGISATYMRFPIRDVSVPSVSQMKMILATLSAAEQVA